MGHECDPDLPSKDSAKSIKGAFSFEHSKYSLRSFSFEAIKEITHDFSSFIVDFQFGKVYRGYIADQEVTVKKWEDNGLYDYIKEEIEVRQRIEIILLNETKVSAHRNVVKLIGYCCEGEDQLCMVYDLKPIDSVHNLVLEDRFRWLHRIKVVVEFAKLLDFLHTAEPSNSQYLLRNIDAAHILLDKDVNPILYDFSQIIGGIFPEWRSSPYNFYDDCIGYRDLCHNHYGPWTEWCDVFPFGNLLLMLISKRVFSVGESYGMPCVFQWAHKDYRSRKSAVGCSKHCLVHKSLVGDCGYYSSDGVLITKLGISCVAGHRARPTMRQVVKKLLQLRVVQEHPDIFSNC